MASDTLSSRDNLVRLALERTENCSHLQNGGHIIVILKHDKNVATEDTVVQLRGQTIFTLEWAKQQYIASHRDPNLKEISLHLLESTDSIPLIDPRTGLINKLNIKLDGIIAFKATCPQYAMQPNPQPVLIAPAPPSTAIPPKDLSLFNVCERSEPAVLEEKVQRGQRNTIKFANACRNGQTGGSGLLAHYRNQIENVRAQAVKVNTIVGVVGSTGAGKSSVLNAVLDEDYLLPTNCMRACTSVPIQIAWNSSIDEQNKYRAEVEFISRADWAKELKNILEDVKDPSGKGNPSYELYVTNTDASIGYAKLRAVYPKFKRKDIGSCTVESLLGGSEDIDKSLEPLGQIRKISAPDAKSFSASLQQYVDSKEKVTAKPADAIATDADSGSDNAGALNQTPVTKRKKRGIEHWPLIKQVKLFLKSPVLESGAILVDLPGVHDSNAARAAVATQFLKRCNALWIVAPITRAVDDQSAKNLLGAAFKRQLQYDGTYSAVTFICSKTDDISVAEVTHSLRESLGEELNRLYDEQSEIKNEQIGLQLSLEDFNKQHQKVLEEMESLEVEESALDSLAEDLSINSPRKDPNQCTVTAQDSEAANETEESLALIRLRRKTNRAERIRSKRQIDEINSKITQMLVRQEAIQVEIKKTCIKGRNRYSTKAIRSDFRAGLEEMDREAAELNAESESETEVEMLRNYELIEQSLPVFCVSSRAYQKLQGRMQQDLSSVGHGYISVFDTGIPQLQRHCIKLTESSRISACQKFLDSYAQLCSSLKLWTSEDCSSIDKAQSEKEREFLNQAIARLDRGLQLQGHTCRVGLQQCIQTHIYDRLNRAESHAGCEALRTAERWIACTADGGIHWATFRAIVRRQGVWSARSKDFNNELGQPMLVMLSSNWERVFHRKFPHIVQKLETDLESRLRIFVVSIQSRLKSAEASLARNTRLLLADQQHKAFQKNIKGVVATLQTEMAEKQRDANRSFIEVVRNIMEPEYDRCAEERGTGTWDRMRCSMHSHVVHQNKTMFREASRNVRQHLESLVEHFEQRMCRKLAAMVEEMRVVYGHILCGSTVGEKKLRQRLTTVLAQSELDASSAGGLENNVKQEVG